MQEGILIR